MPRHSSHFAPNARNLRNPSFCSKSESTPRTKYSVTFSKNRIFKKHFFDDPFFSCCQASNVCSGPGCLVSDISRKNKSSPIRQNHQFEHFWWESLRESCQKIRRIWGFFRNSSDIEDLYLRAQEELGARKTCVPQPLR